jgi:hypothetical protein
MARRGSCVHEASYRVPQKKICFENLKLKALRISMKLIKAVQNIANYVYKEIYSIRFIFYTEKKQCNCYDMHFYINLYIAAISNCWMRLQLKFVIIAEWQPCCLDLNPLDYRV